MAPINLPLLTKKVWKLLRVVMYMLRNSIPKRRLLLEFNMMMKRGKVVGRALQKLMFHHHHNFTSPSSGEYEFSCTNTPSTFSLFSFNKKQRHYSGTQNPKVKELDILAFNAAMMIHSETASPVLPGFGRTPMVRQLRVTDSPFPVSVVEEEDSHVDEAAERFIRRFYNDLRQQN